MKTAVAILCLVAGAAHAQLAVKGVTLGVEKQELMQRFASLQCTRLPPQFAKSGDELCVDSWCGGPACTESSTALTTYGGQPVWQATFAIIGGRAERFAAHFRASSYEEIRDTLKSVHGQGRETHEAMQTLGGARLDARVWDAMLPSGSIILRERALKIDEGSVELITPAFQQFTRRPVDVKKNAGDL